MTRKILGIAGVLLVCLALTPTLAHAQSVITGVVKDTSGAVLPGVTVEAASPALIEKVRTATTDDTGQYRIIDLRPGVYTATFTLTGFSTVKREQLELPADFVSTVNAELRVGTLEETVTVTGESPIVLLFAMRAERSAPAWQIKTTADEEYNHRYTELVLRPLSEAEGNELINRLLANPDLPEGLGPDASELNRHFVDFAGPVVGDRQRVLSHGAHLSGGWVVFNGKGGWVSLYGVPAQRARWG